MRGRDEIRTVGLKVIHPVVEDKPLPTPLSLRGVVWIANERHNSLYFVASEQVCAPDSGVAALTGGWPDGPAGGPPPAHAGSRLPAHAGSPADGCGLPPAASVASLHPPNARGGAHAVKTLDSRFRATEKVAASKRCASQKDIALKDIQNAHRL